jgi:hypothetical protein
MVALAPAAAHAVSFSAGTPFAVGGDPESVAVGDFNADSRPDLAVANGYFNNVSILRGNGSGGFSAPTNITVSGTPRSVAIGNFNGDAHADLATANVDSNNVSILLGNGSGGFSAPTSFAAGSGPISVAVGNFNGDAHADLVTANYRSAGDVSILLGNGSGGFSAPTNFTVGNYPYSVAVGNFNSDSNTDLAAANFGYPYDTSVLLGNGSGGFSAPTNFTVGDEPSWVAVGNFDGDADLDLAVANVTSGNVSILLGDGSGGFSGPTNFIAGSGPNAIAVADFNDDARPDLAVANYYSNNVSILLGNGSGGFGGRLNLSVGNSPTSVAVGDFNGDARLDLAVGNRGSANVSIHLNTTSNAYPRPKGASPARVPLVPAYNQCTAPNSAHGPPDFPGNATNPDGSCSPPAQSSGNLALGTPDANGAPVNSTGFVSLRTAVGNPGGLDDADVAIRVHITDVRCQTGASPCGAANAGGGDDYTGEVQARIGLRITDRNNGTAPPGGTEAGTSATTFQVTVPCGVTPTPDNIGSTCELTTTADAVYGNPNTALEGKRTIWELGQVQVYDGGPDGDSDTPTGDTVFMRQGLFVP